MNITDSPALPPGMPKQRLDHDFNSAWGGILCFDQLSAITNLNPLWREFVTNRLAFERKYDSLLSMYNERFISFFGGYYPIDFQANTRQAMKPALVSKMLLWLASFSLAQASGTAPESIQQDMALRLLDWGDAQVDTPHWAILSDSYAAASASSPTPSPISTPNSNPDRVTYHSTDSFHLNLTPSGTQSDLRAQLEVAKKQGCIGVFIEIVETQYNGRVIDPVLLLRARRTCAEMNLLFAVDESLTAIRCGAPFSFQREEYADIDPPDVVFFGRALAAQGSAVNFSAPFLKSFRLTEDRTREAAVKGWQQRGQSQNSRPVPPAVLIQAIAAADLAEGRDFPMLSRLVGKAVRDLVMAHVKRKGANVQQHEVLGGLDSLVFVHKDLAAEMLIMGASTSEPWMPWIRWFPRLEMEMAQLDVLDAVAGQSSREARRSLTNTLLRQGMRPNWCVSCGNRATNTAQPWCQTCCINVCEGEDCLKMLAEHSCVAG